MIKTLLLATSCVIGSGAGALQNASAFNKHYAITGGNNTTTNIVISIDPQEFTKSNYTPYGYQTGIATEQYNYENFVSVQYSITQRNPYWYPTPEQDPTILFDDGYWTTYYFIKITPFYNYTILNMKTNVLNNVEGAVGEDMNTDVRLTNYITNDANLQNSCEQIISQYGYGNRSYNPFGIFTQTEKNSMLQNSARITTEYIEQEIQYTTNEQNAGTNLYYETITDANGTWQRFKGDWQKNYMINNSRQPIYIMQMYEYEINPSPEGKWPIGYYSNNDFSSEITLTLETPLTPSEPGDIEIVPIGDLMFQILTMPFAFISQAFNLTLFPDTAYSVNVSRLFLAVFAALVFIWIMKKFIKK